MTAYDAHRDRRHFECQPSLSGHCGHGAIFGAQRSVAIDPSQKLACLSCCSTKAVLAPYQSTRLSRYNAVSKGQEQL